MKKLFVCFLISIGLLQATEPKTSPWEEEFFANPVYAAYDPDQSIRRETLAEFKQALAQTPKTQKVVLNLTVPNSIRSSITPIIENENFMGLLKSFEIYINSLSARFIGAGKIDEFENYEYFFRLARIEYFIKNPDEIVWDMLQRKIFFEETVRHIAEYYMVNNFEKFFRTFYHLHRKGRTSKMNVSGVVDDFFSLGLVYNNKSLNFVTMGHDFFDFLTHAKPLCFEAIFKENESFGHFMDLIQNDSNQMFSEVSEDEKKFRHRSMRIFSLNLRNYVQNRVIMPELFDRFCKVSYYAYVMTGNPGEFNDLELVYLCALNADLTSSMVEWPEFLGKKPEGLLTAAQIQLMDPIYFSLLDNCEQLKQRLVSVLYKKPDIRKVVKTKKAIETRISKRIKETRAALEAEKKRRQQAAAAAKALPEVPDALQEKYNAEFEKSLTNIKGQVEMFLSNYPEFKPLFLNIGAFNPDQQTIDQEALDHLEKRYGDKKPYQNLKSYITAVKGLFTIEIPLHKVTANLLKKCREMITHLAASFQTMEELCVKIRETEQLNQEISDLKEILSILPKNSELNPDEKVPDEPTTMRVPQEKRSSKRSSKRLSRNPNPEPTKPKAPAEFLWQEPTSKALDPSMKAKHKSLTAIKEAKEEKKHNSFRRSLRNAFHMDKDQTELNPKGKRLSSRPASKVIENPVPVDYSKFGAIDREDMDPATKMLWDAGDQSTDPNAPKVIEILKIINEVTSFEDLQNSLKRFKFKPLKSLGNLRNLGRFLDSETVYSVRIKGTKMRVCFTWDENAKTVHKVLYTNYHRH